MLRIVTLVLLLLSSATFARSLYLRLGPLRALRRAGRIDRVRERAALLFRFGVGQLRLVDPEERVAGVLHVVLFASFWVLTLRSVTLFGIALFGPDFHLPLLGPQEALGPAYGFVKDVLAAGALAAAGAFLFWRISIRPDRLTRSAEGFVLLLLIAALMVTELTFEGATRCTHGTPGTFGAPVSSLAASALVAVGLRPPALRLWVEGALLLHLSLLLAFLNLLPHGKHFHLLTALPNVFLARLSPRSALSPLDLEDEDASYGTATVKDLSWKDGLDVLACTECGRCQTHCPTYLSGKPLSHKEVNRALRRHLEEQGACLLALARSTSEEGKAAEDLMPLVSVIPPETAWACTTCGWCETACPVLIDNIPRLMSMRRQQVLVEADFPEEAQRVFRGIESQGNPWGFGSNRRTEWCADLNLPRASDGRPFEWLFFVGCAGAFDERQQKVSRALVALLRRAGVSFAILGEEETCTGDAARRLGNEYLFQIQARALVEVLHRRNVRKILVQCPHCLNTLRNELPAFGGHFQVVHHAELLAQLVETGRLPLEKGQTLHRTTYHDPCYLARWGGVTEPPRELLRAAGARLVEMPRNRRQGFCCGAGGGRFWLEEPLGMPIQRMRAAEAAQALGADGGTVVTGCPFCLTTLHDGVVGLGSQSAVQVLDVAELVAKATRTAC